jgi:hypothetical protein
MRNEAHATSSGASKRAGEDELAGVPRVRELVEFSIAKCSGVQLLEFDVELLALAAAGAGVAGVDELELEPVPESVDVELELEDEVVLDASVDPAAVVDELFDELEPEPLRLSVL